MPNNNPFRPSPELQSQIRALAAQGLSSYQIAKETGQTRDCVYNWCRKHGAVKDRSIYTPWLIRHVAELRKTGMSHAKIAEKLNVKEHVSQKCWARWLASEGVEAPAPKLAKPAPADPIKHLAVSMPWTRP